MTTSALTFETRRIAYNQTPGAGPGIVFLSGFNSNQNGTKATFLEDWARRKGRAYLRFDYSGHGASSGRFEDGTIGQWAEDAAQVVTGLTTGPQIIVGSSMGGWIACLLARRMPERFAGLVTIAAAPDFTEEHHWKAFSAAQRRTLLSDARIEVQSPYDDKPYTITRNLIEEARAHLILADPLKIKCPMRLLHGSADKAIPLGMAYRLFEHITGEDVQLTVVKGADHRFSTPANLRLVAKTIDDIAPTETDAR